VNELKQNIDEQKTHEANYNRRIRVRRAIIFLVLNIAYLTVYFHRVSPAVIVNDIFVLFNVKDAAVVGSLAAVYFYVYFLMQIPAGLLADLLGPRKIIFAGMLVSGIGSIWFGLTSSLSGLFVARFLIGLGVSVIFISLIRVYSTWFKPREFGTVIGLSVFIGNLGAIIAATPLAAMIAAFGLRYTFVLVGLFSLAVALLAWFVVRDDPQELLVPKHGYAKEDKRVAMSLSTMGSEIYKVVYNRYVWHAFASAFCVYGPFMAIAGIWGVPYLMQVYGMDRSTAATFMIISTIGVMFGSFAIGFISDRLFSRKKPYLAFVIGNAMVWAALVFWNDGAPPHNSLFIIFFLLGVFGNTGMVSTIMVKEYNPPAVAGLASGIGNIGAFVGSALMQPFLGYLLDRKWDGAIVEGIKFYPLQAFQYAFGACFIFSCLAIVNVFLLRESFKKE